MRLLILNPWSKVIGPNKYLYQLLHSLPGLAANSTVIFPHGSDAARDYALLGCRVEVWPETDLIHPKLELENILTFGHNHTLGLIEFVSRVNSMSPDLILSNGENLWIGGLAARILRVPHLQVFHTLAFKYRLQGRPLASKVYLKFLSLLADRFIAVSEVTARALMAAGVLGEQISVIPNPIAVEELRHQAALPLSAELERLIEGRQPILVTAGRLSPVKGQDLLVSALPAIISRYPRALCFFAGKVMGNEGLDDAQAFVADLQAEISKHGLTAHAAFLGEIEEFPSLLARADLCVQPSRSESFGRVVAEALICSTPVVAFNVDAIPETGGAGVKLAKPLEPASLADAVLELLGNSEEAERLVTVGSQHVEAHYEAALIAPRFEALVREVL